MPNIVYMSRLGFALYEAYRRGVPTEEIARRLDLPLDWVNERIEAARLCLIGGESERAA